MSSTVRNTVLLALTTMAIFGFAKVFRSQSATTGLTGQWSIQATGEGRARLQLQSNTKAKGRASFQLALTQFEGLSEAQVSASSSRVDFRLVREAGTINFSGSFHDRAGTGEWTFKPDPAFISALRNRGYEQPTHDELFALVVSDVRTSYLTELEHVGYNAIPLNELVALKSNDVSAPYIKSLADAGYKGLTTAQLLALRTNGVTRDYIEGLEKRGQKNLTVERLLSLRTNGF